MPPPSRQPASDHSRSRTLTLLIASASSVVAALLVSKVWGPGTLVGAAATPVIVTLVGELLRRPAEKITVVRTTASGTRVRERVEASEAPVGAVIAQDEMGPTSVHRARGRRPLIIALVTGLVAFIIGAVVLSGTELVVGNKLGAGGGSTTYLGGGGHAERTKETPATTGTAPVPATTPAPPAPTKTTTTTTTTTVPAPVTPPAATTTSTSPPAAPPATGGAPATGATGP